MKRNPQRTAIAVALSILLGSFATTMTSGCQKPEADTSGPADVATAAPVIETGTVEKKASTDAKPEAKSEAKTEAAPSEPAKAPEKSAPAGDKPAEEKSAAASEKPADKPADKPAKPADKPVADQPSNDKPSSDKPASDKPADGAKSEAATTTKEPVRVALAPGDKGKLPIDKSANAPVKAGDWPMWGGTTFRNNVPIAKNIPIDWVPGEIDRKTQKWVKEGSKNIVWASQLGSQSYGNPVVAGGHVFVGTNNNNGYLKRYSADVDLGCLLCFAENDGQFMWQHSSEKLPTGRVHDWPQMGICCAPYVEGNRLWFVTSRGEVRCLDTEGFYDGEDDGPVVNDLAKLVEIMKAEDPAMDQVAGIVEQLDAGKISDGLKAKLAAAGEQIGDDAAVAVDTAGKKWTITATIQNAKRTLPVAVQGPRLVVSKVITPDDKQEADVVWVYDMMKQLRVSQHNMCSCSVTAWGDILFVCTSNGVDESHINIPATDAASFMAMNKNTGEVYWTDSSPGENIHHGQWSSPTVAMIGGELQVLFGGGDGWLYSFKADTGKDGKPELLWKFDCNPKEAKLILGGRGTRNDIIGTPVVYDGLVYVAVGQDPEHGEGIGHLWCIDPTKRGDVSSQLAVKVEDRAKPIPHRREQAVIPEKGEVTVDNPNSAVVWHYSEFDRNGDGTFDFEETMHRTCGTVAIKNDLLYIADFSGLFHCLDAKTGKVHWTHDMLAAAWGSPLIVENHVYIGDEDGDISIFNLTAEAHEPIAVINMGNSVYSTPIVANDMLFIANKTHLFAIKALEEK